ncbi:3-hydroxyacyl-CoA dehydrogenase/enoyl-CoA hydratase family protein [Ruegeria sp. Ofav3-42]|uniref:3-hydroxyacyl-CoA dehydrogenase/enoyl-CoA hydratase family protein n=1 Tax=Ruegeria sp. Ofav3-42 TaxID=2917759 RepID=UPI001EF43E64|nr:3-hydroxyacyl-CoA dehydrogenase/enoyl-CoA hydratase family protein [Ruegeria sp. Ofav3-42]MCG7519907.1 3-hydroxyacyl-CoA dehydrogenase NAD-binding domain-containing protein [Ruegeria sp. Ofav3-42]
MSAINKVAVIGSGVMGAGIAAHFANAGAEVVLLDIVPKDAEDRSMLAKSAIARMTRGRAPQLADPAYAARLTAGNLEDDLEQLRDCDWVVEVVLEDLAIKHALYAKIAPYLRDDALLSSNTSTIPLADLVSQMGDDLRKRFVIVHFFNPPRYMRLIELVTGPDTDPAAAERARAFSDKCLGKTVVPCNDRPGFIANRLGGLWMNAAAREAVTRGITVEEADTVLARPFGVPGTGVFALMDLIGIDLMGKSRLSMRNLLESEDPQQLHTKGLELFDQMAAKGLAGRKAGAGFYRRSKDANGKTVAEVVDLATLDYRTQAKGPDLSKSFGVDFIDQAGDRLADYAWAVMGPALSYAAYCVPEITANPADIDAAMELGYNWRMGPFKLIDKIGADKIVARLKSEGLDVPPLLELAAERGGIYSGMGRDRKVLLPSGEQAEVPRGPGMIFASDLTDAPEFQTEAVALHDMGDGVALLTITAPNAALDDQVMTGVSEALDVVGRDFKAMVIGSDGNHFSVGANLKKALDRADAGELDLVEGQLAIGQATMRKIKYAPFPVVSAACGLALGGGCEILMHSDRVMAALESNIGLVEANVGLLPAWGGTTALLLRKTAELGDPVKGAEAAFDVISVALMTGSAPMAQHAGYLKATDGVVMNRDRLLAEAKAAALALADGYQPASMAEITLDAAAINAALEPKLAALADAMPDAPYTVEIARETAHVLAGGDGGTLDEEALHKLEADGMMRLIRQDKTIERMRHTMTTGKPLKN